MFAIPTGRSIILPFERIYRYARSGEGVVLGGNCEWLSPWRGSPVKVLQALESNDRKCTILSIGLLEGKGQVNLGAISEQ